MVVIMKTLESERLILRNWKASDLAGFRPKTDKEDSFKNLQKFIAESDDLLWEVELRELDKLVFWAIELKELNKAVGWIELCETECKLENRNFKYFKEIGFTLAEEYWGQGLMPEAIRRVLNYLFNEEKIDAVLCSHFINNSQSEKAIKKCGFKFYLEDQEEKYYYLTKNVIVREN